MGPVDLLVVVRDPGIVDVAQLRPAGGLADVPVGHPALDVEGRFNIGVPGLTEADLLLPDLAGSVDTPSLLSQEDAPIIADQRFGRPVLAHRGEQNDQKGVQVLGSR
jgi:hypothetical protein